MMQATKDLKAKVQAKKQKAMEGEVVQKGERKRQVHGENEKTV